MIKEDFQIHVWSLGLDDYFIYITYVYIYCIYILHIYNILLQYITNTNIKIKILK